MKKLLERIYGVLFPFLVGYMWRLLLFKLFSGTHNFEPFLDLPLSLYLFMDSNPVDFSPNLSFPPSVNQEEIFQELDGEGQQPIEVDPSTPDSDLFDLDKEGDKITFYEDAISDLVHELRDEEKRPLPDEPHRINRAIDRVRENFSAPDKKESDSLAGIAKEIQENRLMSRAYFYFNSYLDIEVKDDLTGVTEEELIKDHDEGS